ncbi:MAG: HAD hydrolase-like protein, partial [Anaerolineae bacterium]
ELERSETLAIGDREIDVAAGKAAGLDTCRFGSAQENTEADYHVSSLAEVYPYLAIHPNTD